MTRRYLVALRSELLAMGIGTESQLSQLTIWAAATADGSHVQDALGLIRMALCQEGARPARELDAELLTGPGDALLDLIWSHGSNGPQLALMPDLGLVSFKGVAQTNPRLDYVSGTDPAADAATIQALL